MDEWVLVSGTSESWMRLFLARTASEFSRSAFGQSLLQFAA
jgi:hypothetical protein